MTNFYVNNLHLQRDGLETISTGELKGSLEDGSTPDHQSSKNVLLPSHPRLLPQVIASCLACWINLSAGASLGYVTPALPSLQDSTSRLQISDEEGSWVAGVILLGGLIGGLLSGPCISYGRRKTLWLTSIPLGTAWVLIAAAPNVISIYIGHFIHGVTLGIINDASQLYILESAWTQWRGGMGCITVLTFNVGVLSCYVAGAWLGWEHLAIFGAALTLPSFVLPLAIPESPSYLMAKGHYKEAIKALQWLRGEDWDITVEYQELLHCEKGPTLVARLRELRNQEILRPILLTVAMRALSRFCGLRAIQSYTHSILEQSHSGIDNKTATIVMGAVQLVATLSACLLLEKLGRRKVLISSLVVMALSLLGLACWLHLKHYINSKEGSFYNWTPVIVILTYIVANSMGLGPVSAIVMGEVVPQRHRSIASSITSPVSWLSAFIVTKTFLDMKAAMHLYGTMWFYGGICLAGIPFVYFCLPETRGISQYEIEVLFRKKQMSNSLE